jgi:colanic acid/amylovoran biosynthesis protein WcaK/AmsJ
MKILLIGATFATGNLGVSALADSSIECILCKWPEADIALLGVEPKNDPPHKKVSYFSIFKGKNIFLKNNLYRLLSIGYLRRYLPSFFSKTLGNSNSSMKEIIDFDLILDITGGDSFSDIYGFKRFIQKFLILHLFMTYNIQYVLLPQTYGPFKHFLTKYIAKIIFKYADPIYCRDNDSYQLVQEILGEQKNTTKVKQFPDVAFIMKPTKPKLLDEVEKLEKLKEKEKVLVGLNVSGLLFNNEKNMFNLNLNYRDLVYSFVDSFLKEHDAPLILFPHVVTSSGHFENDSDACNEIYEYFKNKYPNRIFPIVGNYNHSEIKYAIGYCNFFLGSRMHSCIAALSQNIPAIGLAYSKKFKGVFESVGCENLVVDLRSCTKEQVIERINHLIKDQKNYINKLEETIPKAKKDLENLFLN